MWWFASVSKGRLQSHCLMHAVPERNGALVLANQLSFFPYSFELSFPLISCIDATTRSLKNPPSFTDFLTKLERSILFTLLFTSTVTTRLLLTDL